MTTKTFSLILLLALAILTDTALGQQSIDLKKGPLFNTIESFIDEMDKITNYNEKGIVVVDLNESSGDRFVQFREHDSVLAKIRIKHKFSIAFVYSFGPLTPPPFQFLTIKNRPVLIYSNIEFFFNYDKGGEKKLLKKLEKYSDHTSLKIYNWLVTIDSAPIEKVVIEKYYPPEYF